MSAELIFKIIGIGLLVSVSHQLLVKSGRDEQAMLVTLAGIVVVLLMLIGEISELLNTIKELFGL
ncbi:MAG: stage III sporulation protein AC [Clostridia bacterium]|nr:stage III sporulation protein AC [Clostridia bacterium]